MQSTERDSNAPIVLESRNNDNEMKMMVWTELEETEGPSHHSFDERIDAFTIQLVKLDRECKFWLCSEWDR